MICNMMYQNTNYKLTYFLFLLQVTTMKTSPYLVIIFLKILVISYCAGQLLQSQFIKRRNSLFNARNRYSRQRNLQAQQHQHRLNNFKRNNKLRSSKNIRTGRQPTKNDLIPRKEVFFVKLEDGFFGCQVNASVDVLQLFEISKLCDGTSQCWQGSDESNAKLKCTSKY